MPEEGLLGGVLVLAGGLLLVIPGVVSDVLGLLLLLPPTRRIVARWVRRGVERRMASGSIRVTTFSTGPFPGGPFGPPRWSRPFLPRLPASPASSAARAPRWMPSSPRRRGGVAGPPRRERYGWMGRAGTRAPRASARPGRSRPAAGSPAPAAPSRRASRRTGARLSCRAAAGARARPRSTAPRC
ncbi:FxsA family protein [Cystobacter fuscus]